MHPHRGLETGAGGVNNPGDTQWMTAAGGILHKEYSETRWAERGGIFHLMQLWVNLPGGGTVSLVAGDFDGVCGPARTPDGEVAFEHLGLFERSGGAVRITAGDEGARVIFLGGRPLEEPIASYGPFVTNTREQLVEAVNDVNAGKFGTLS